MNRALLQQFISAYKREFNRISRQEIYKWRAVKQFQDNWKLDAVDFAGMLSLSLLKTNNLLAASQYLPRKMIEVYSQKQPDKVRKLFIELFDEDNDLITRIKAFQDGAKEINDKFLPGRSTYQDPRAVLVYLVLKYPDVYFLYKYKMFKAFCEKVDLDYKPKLHAKFENVLQYLNMCTLIREALVADNELLKLHTERIHQTEYLDAGGNILTQDFIYAVTEYLQTSKEPLLPSNSKLTLRPINLEIINKQYSFKGQFIDHVTRQRRNKFIGDLGEQIVLQHERLSCPARFVDKIVHSSKSEGDGLGFDILSYDQNGNQKYIEVKAAKGSANKPFFISRTELERSRVEGVKYFLYRLYNLDEEHMTADYYIIQGDLSKYCVNASEFEVVLTILS